MRRQIKIGSIIKQIRGVSYKPSDVRVAGAENAVALLRANNIQEAGLNFDDLIYINRSEVKDEQYLRAGDILICSSSGSKNLVGKAAYVPENLPMSFGAFCKVVRTQTVDSCYLGHYFQSPRYRREISEVSAGANINNIRNEHIDELTIPDHSKSEQMEIVRILTCVDKQIECTNQQLTKLDELVKSRFVEMFGDPEQNPKGWPVVSITEIVGGKVSNGFFAKRDAYRDDGNVQVLGVANVVNRMYSNIASLPRTNATQTDEEKYAVKYGDMLFCRSSLVAEGIGKASIVPKDTPRNVLFECHVIRLPLDLRKCIPEFVQELSTTDFFRRQIIAQSKTATMTTIGQDGILKSMIILPPVEQQQEFLCFVEQVDKSKLAVKQSLEKLETLKKLLMQQYFG